MAKRGLVGVVNLRSIISRDLGFSQGKAKIFNRRRGGRSLTGCISCPLVAGCQNFGETLKGSGGDINKIVKKAQKA